MQCQDDPRWAVTRSRPWPQRLGREWARPPRSLAADANDCIMVRSPQGSTEYKVVAPIVATPGRLALDRLALSFDRPTPPDFGCRSAPAGRTTTRSQQMRKKVYDVKQSALDKESPIQGRRAAPGEGTRSIDTPKPLTRIASNDAIRPLPPGPSGRGDKPPVSSTRVGQRPVPNSQ
jgi:hypothetical protein